jgi:uncharacterized membrane protein YsdA (DUF1294 family)
MALLLALVALVVVNLITMLRFWQDKVRAVEGDRRVPEADLLALAMVGGSPGTLLARRVFRHKTRKQLFSNHLYLIVAVQTGALIGLVLL